MDPTGAIQLTASAINFIWQLANAYDDCKTLASDLNARLRLVQSRLEGTGNVPKDLAEYLGQIIHDTQETIQRNRFTRVVNSEHIRNFLQQLLSRVDFVVSLFGTLQGPEPAVGSKHFEGPAVIQDNPRAQEWWFRNFNRKQVVDIDHFFDAVRETILENGAGGGDFDRHFAQATRSWRDMLDSNRDGKVTVHEYKRFCRGVDVVTMWERLVSCGMIGEENEVEELGAPLYVKQVTKEDYSAEEFLSICISLGMFVDEELNIPGKVSCTDYIRKSQAKSQKTPTAVVQAKATYTKLSKGLLDGTQKLKELFARIPQEDRTQALNESFDKMPNFVDVIANPQCKLIVFGEVNAGKSLFMNLLLEYRLLPSMGRAATMSISEITYAHQGAIVYQNGNTGREETKVLHPTGNTDAQLLDILASLRDRTSCNVTHIKWPANILKAGITLVDSPGINENEELDARVQTYLPSCSGIICVIDAAASGVSRSILKVLADAKSVLGDHFNPSAFLFVCSKLDRVPKPDRQDNMNQIKHNLSRWFTEERESIKGEKRKLYPDFNAEEQVIFLNLMTSFAATEYGLETEEYKKYKPKIVSFIERGYFFKLQNCYNQSWDYMKPGELLIKSMIAENKKARREIEADREEYKRVLNMMTETYMKPSWEALAKSIQHKLKSELFVAAQKIDVRKLMESAPLPTKKTSVDDIIVEYAERVRKVWRDAFKQVAGELYNNAKREFAEGMVAKLVDAYKALKVKENSLIGIDEFYADDILNEVKQLVDNASDELTAGELVRGAVLLPVGIVFGAAAFGLAAVTSPIWGAFLFHQRVKDKRAAERALRNPNELKEVVYEVILTPGEAQELADYYYRESNVERYFQAMIKKGLQNMVKLKKTSEELIKKKEEQCADKQQYYLPLNAELEAIQTQLFYISHNLDEKLYNGQKVTYVPKKVEDAVARVEGGGGVRPPHKPPTTLPKKPNSNHNSFSGSGEYTSRPEADQATIKPYGFEPKAPPVEKGPRPLPAGPRPPPGGAAVFPKPTPKMQPSGQNQYHPETDYRVNITYVGIDGRIEPCGPGHNQPLHFSGGRNSERFHPDRYPPGGRSGHFDYDPAYPGGYPGAPVFPPQGYVPPSPQGSWTDRPYTPSPPHPYVPSPPSGHRQLYDNPIAYPPHEPYPPQPYPPPGGYPYERQPPPHDYNRFERRNSFHEQPYPDEPRDQRPPHGYYDGYR